MFSEIVVGFTAADVTVGGTATFADDAPVVTVSTDDNITWTITVSGMVTDGTVIASIAAGVAADPAENANLASTSTDNTVTYHEDSNTPPTVSGTLDTTTPTTDQTLTATAEVSDADGDPVTLTFVWSVNGVVVQTTADTTCLTDTFDLSVCRTWRCRRRRYGNRYSQRLRQQRLAG